MPPPASGADDIEPPGSLDHAGGRPEYEGIDGAVTGYVIDGDLRVDGNVLNLEYGRPSLAASPAAERVAKGGT
ncbi:hypothetical protein ACFV3E_23150 [Streptomyces sp. NPDC059718]